jgi:hypothetical protein
MLSAAASPANLFRVASGGIDQERALTSALTSPVVLLETLSEAFSKPFSDTGDDLGLNTGNASVAYFISEALSEAKDAWTFNLGLPGLLISGNSDLEEVTSEDAAGCSDCACGIAGVCAIELN